MCTQGRELNTKALTVPHLPRWKDLHEVAVFWGYSALQVTT